MLIVIAVRLREELHAALRTLPWPALPHLGMHGAGIRPHFCLLPSAFCLPTRHGHRQGCQSGKMHLQLHVPHHFASRVHHHHDHEQNHDEHAAHVHHDLNGEQQIGAQHKKESSERDEAGHQRQRRANHAHGQDQARGHSHGDDRQYDEDDPLQQWIHRRSTMTPTIIRFTRAAGRRIFHDSASI